MWYKSVLIILNLVILLIILVALLVDHWNKIVRIFTASESSNLHHLKTRDKTALGLIFLIDLILIVNDFTNMHSLFSVEMWQLRILAFQTITCWYVQEQTSRKDALIRVISLGAFLSFLFAIMWFRVINAGFVRQWLFVGLASGGIITAFLIRKIWRSQVFFAVVDLVGLLLSISFLVAIMEKNWNEGDVYIISVITLSRCNTLIGVLVICDTRWGYLKDENLTFTLVLIGKSGLRKTLFLKKLMEELLRPEEEHGNEVNQYNRTSYIRTWIQNYRIPLLQRFTITNRRIEGNYTPKTKIGIRDELIAKIRLLQNSTFNQVMPDDNNWFSTRYMLHIKGTDYFFWDTIGDIRFQQRTKSIAANADLLLLFSSENDTESNNFNLIFRDESKSMVLISYNGTRFTVLNEEIIEIDPPRRKWDCHMFNQTNEGTVIAPTVLRNLSENDPEVRTTLISTICQWEKKREWSHFYESLFVMMACGVLLPLVVIFQTSAFLCYRQNWGYDHTIFDEDFFSKELHICIFDFFYPLFERPVYNLVNIDNNSETHLKDFVFQPSRKIQVDSFFRQSIRQKIGRLFFSFIITGFFIFAIHNFLSFVPRTKDVYVIDTIGPLVLYAFIWISLLCWFCYEMKQGEISDKNERGLRNIKFWYKEGRNKICSNVDILLKFYYYNETKEKIWITAGIIISSFIYGAIPTCFRAYQGNKLLTDQPRIALVGSTLNFLLACTMQFLFKGAFFNYLKKYFTLLTSITELIEITHEKPQLQGLNPEKFRLLAFDYPPNSIAWFEMRSYLWIKGIPLFAELEAFLASFCSFIISEGLFVFFTIVLGNFVGPTAVSVVYLMVIQIVWLLFVLNFGTGFDKLQARQINALRSQNAAIRLDRSFRFMAPHIPEERKENHDDNKSTEYCNFDIFTRETTVEMTTVSNFNTYEIPIQDNFDEENNINSNLCSWETNKIGCKFNIQELEFYLGFLEQQLRILKGHPLHPKIFNFSLNGALRLSVYSSIGSVLLSFCIYIIRLYM